MTTVPPTIASALGNDPAKLSALTQHKADFGTWESALAALHSGTALVAAHGGVPPQSEDFVRGALGRAIQGEHFDPMAELGNLAQQQPVDNVTAPSLDTTPSVPTGDMPPNAPTDTYSPVPASFKGYVPPVKGKLIGTPFAGTHATEFNINGGSNNWESENAVDVAVPVGTPIRAVSNGVIGKQFGSLGEGGRFAGLRLHLVTDGNEFYYAHLSRFARGVQPGARVRRGQIIGYSGEANGVAHLHFGSRDGSPMTLYGGAT